MPRVRDNLPSYGAIDVPGHADVGGGMRQSTRRLRLQRVVVAAITILATVAVVQWYGTDSSHPVSTLQRIVSLSSNSPSSQTGAPINEPCKEGLAHLGQDAVQFVSLWLQAHEHTTGKFVCKVAFEEVEEGETVWLRGTVGSAPQVWAVQVSKVPSQGSHLPAVDSPLQGDEDSHQFVNCPSKDVLLNGTVIHRTELQKDSCSFLMLHVKKVSATETDAISDNVLEDARKAGWNARLSANVMTSSTHSLLQTSAGLIVPSEEVLAAEPVMSPSELAAVTTPTQYDFTKEYPGCYSNDIDNQGSCGSCWAFAASKAFDNAMCQASNMTVNIQASQQELVSCGKAGGCGGGWISQAVDAIKDDGVVTEQCFPYSGKDTTTGTQCNTGCSDGLKYHVTDSNPYKRVTTSSTDIAAVQAALVKYGPLWVGMKTCQSFFAYSSGVFQPLQSDGDCGSLSHAVVIVGYDADSWTIANSWGDRWGDKGYCKISKASGIIAPETAYAIIPDPSKAKCRNTKCLNDGSVQPDCSCKCETGYSGADCGTCSKTCQNGGLLDANACKCICPSGYFGANCEEHLTVHLESYDYNTRDAKLKVSWSITNFNPGSGRNFVFRSYSNTSTSGCQTESCTPPVQALNSKTGSLIIDTHFRLYYVGRPNQEYCLSAMLWRGNNEFGASKGSDLVRMPCFYLEQKEGYPNGRCVSGGNEVTDASSNKNAYHAQCHTVPPPPVCEDNHSGCSAYKSYGYCTHSQQWVKDWMKRNCFKSCEYCQ